MELALYGKLTPWYRLLDPTDDHEDEVVGILEALEGGIVGPRETLLELGAGAGNNAAFLKAAYRCTLTDPSSDMLALSRELNPECEHLRGDMRTLRLERHFDAVLIHDAIVYMTTEDELREAMQTAFVHLRPGGAAVLLPDCYSDQFREYSQLHEGADETRALRCLEWSWDPDPTDTRYTVEYAFLLRDGDSVTAIHDRHVEGLFARETWLALAREVGFEVTLVRRSLEDADPASRDVYAEEVLLCRKPMKPEVSVG